MATGRVEVITRAERRRRWSPADKLRLVMATREPGATVEHGRRTFMDVETAIRALASAGHELPREAMRWALDNWDEAVPGMLGVLERFADGTDRSEEAANAAFFILHLAGERRETRAFAPLRRLAKDAEAIEAVLGDGVTTTLKGILISTYDGDLDALKGVIETEGADQYVRAGALEVLAYLAATGRVARQEAETYLLRLYDALEPQHENFVWVGWQSAISLLGLETMSGVVRQAFGRGLIDPMVTNYDHFRGISGGRLPIPSAWRASTTIGSRRSRTRSESCPAGTPSRTRSSGIRSGAPPAPAGSASHLLQLPNP